MPKSKQQKQKERQRRIAKEKHEAATQKQTEAKANHENKTLSRAARVMTAAAPPKTDYVADKSKTAFMHRRTGG
jgi:hypothetical protein